MNSGFKPGITQKAAGVWRLWWRKWWILLVDHVDRKASTLVAFSFFIVNSFHSGCSLEYGDSEVANVTFQSPSFLVVILKTKMTSEALATKVNAGIFAVLFDKDFGSQWKAESLGCSSIKHDVDDPLHRAHRELKMVELILENWENVSYYLVEISTALS